MAQQCTELAQLSLLRGVISTINSTDQIIINGVAHVTPCSAIQTQNCVPPGASQIVSLYGSSDNPDPNPKNNTAFVGYRVKVPVMFQTSPPGLLVSTPSNATPAVAPLLVQWDPAGAFSFGTPSPQNGPNPQPGVQYVFSTWCNQSVCETNPFESGVSPPPATPPNYAPGTFIATFNTEDLLTVNVSPSGAGNVAASVGALNVNSSGNAWYKNNATVRLAATPSPGYVFDGFAGDLNTTTNPVSITMSVPRTVTAHFSCAYSLSSYAAYVSAAASGFNIDVTAGSGCPWTVTATPSWLTITSGNPGMGNGTVSFQVGAEQPPGFRTATFTVAGQTFTLIQSAIYDPDTFVSQLYSDLLARTADAGGLAYWAGQITSGAMTYPQVASAFFQSAEFSGSGLYVIKLYEAILHRDPDFGGWQYWFSVLQSGATQSTVLNAFLSSQEFQNTYGIPTNANFITLVYLNVLGRAPDPDGYSYWLNQLNTGAMTQAEMMGQFITSAEYASDIRARAYANLLYMGFLRRTADAGGLAYWTSVLADPNALPAVIGDFITSTEYLNRF